ncbi:HAD family hydrolase [Marivita hallyeonensis]|uniref:Haloacid dehalogenase superfamily, subfamily IA, variant 3 with third motif having DD or ED n=1 Tax=Marivita hallyeonensis TaxID=996342 RepID=A0A1M5QVT0_9RHOB|nr:HAD family phosphatase [Marivita hallyeonensis]SHH18254.1 haloacid dehalogenase superfamily, subfamily IA, variant 3 with third motif having DD or ED [Marivita hallyeonensis]
MPALLFDLDGTMLNSDAIHEQVYRELWASRGLEMTDGFYMAHVHGRLNVDVFAEFLPDEPDPQGLSEWKEAEFRARLPRPYPPMPGVLDVLETARAQGWAVSVVTNAMRLNADAMLAAIGAQDFVDDVIIGEECTHAKPHPEPYLTAMSRLEVAHHDCIAFEDSPTGVRAATASGAFTIGVRSALSDADLRDNGAHATIQDFTDTALPALLDRLKGAAA